MKFLVSLFAAATLLLTGACGGEDGVEPDTAATEAAPGEEASDHSHAIDEIKGRLDEVLDLYEAEDFEAAGELVADTYLEMYEEIEHDIEEVNEELNEELEPLLGGELRRQIDKESPLAEIEALVDRAKELLDEALAALNNA